MISRHLREYGYKNVLPQSTHMLTSNEKHRRVQWAKKHKSNDFTSTIFAEMRRHFSFFAIQFGDGQKLPIMN